MMKHVKTAVIYTAITAVLLGVVYPLAMTGVAKMLFPAQAKGELVYAARGELVGSKLIGQPFTGARYFDSRPSAAGTGYDAAASSGSNLGPTSRALVDRIGASVAAEAAADPGNGPVPVDLVTTSASGLDPDMTPAAALYQVGRVARERHLPVGAVEALVRAHVTERQFGLLGEPRVNVLDLNLALDRLTAEGTGAAGQR